MLGSYSDIMKYFSHITEDDRVPHALLLLGQEGTGQLRAAVEWAKMLQCTEGELGSYCGKCKSCIKMDNFSHPDVHFAFPVIKHEKFKREETTSKQFMDEWRHFLKTNIHGTISDWLDQINGLNKTFNINVAECNEIIHNLGLKTYEGKYKIQIIWHAESLAKEGNRLLKLIEEPTGDTLIILISQNHNAILNTIQSRCQILKLPAYTDSEIEGLLERDFDIDQKELKEFCFLADGNMRKAIELARHNSMNYSADMLDWLRKCYKADPDELLSVVTDLNAFERETLKAFFRYMLHFLREYLMAFQMQSSDNTRLSTTERNVVLKLQKILDLDKTCALQKLINKNLAYIDRNLSIKIMLMDMSLKINEILRAEVNKFA